MHGSGETGASDTQEAPNKQIISAEGHDAGVEPVASADSTQATESVSNGPVNETAPPEVVPGGDGKPNSVNISSDISATAVEADAETAKEGSPATLVEPNGASEKPADAEHLPEPPASPTSNTAHSGTSNVSTVNADLPAKPVAADRMPSANRLSISYAAGSRRLVIDAEVVDVLKVFRSEGRIEVVTNFERLGEGFKGILVKHLSKALFFEETY